MPLTVEKQCGTYRCPVCGHRDLAVLDPGDPRNVVHCSYCETRLEISPRAPDSVRFHTQVAGQPAAC